MKKTEYEQMSLREETYWWHVGRLSIVDSLLSKFDKKNENKILNIGCGTGGTIPILEKYGEVVNVDISSEALKFLRQKGYKGTKVSGNGLPFEDNEFDFVVALDVLEHIDQDREALNEWHRVLKPGGQLMITVPAHAFLWSGHDVSLHHFRRYTTKKLRWDAEKAHFKTAKISYMVAFSFPLVVGFRLLHKARKKTITEETSYVNTPPAVNSLFTKILVGEGKLLKHSRLPIGTSVVGIFTK